MLELAGNIIARKVGRQGFTGGRSKRCFSVRVKIPFSGVAGCVDKP